ncbi:DUF6084 family protein [Paraconexibacter sp.]|uniref:DUF6084 family protein n=1 Tax=Paraconexibacter sp. TaxID=2949640 RepID=UPI00356B49EC
MKLEVIASDEGSPSNPTAEPVFEVLDVESVPYAATPTLRFHLHVSDPAGRAVHAIALSTQIQIQPARRTYDRETQERLVELFGAPERWAATTHPFQWARIEALVPGFTGATSFAVEVPCTYDLEVASAKYFHGLRDGTVPLTFHFSGMILYRGTQDHLQVVPVPWSCHAQWAMPIAAWRAAMDEQYPGGGWVRLAPATLDRLAARKAARGHRSFDDTVHALLDERGEGAP